MYFNAVAQCKSNKRQIFALYTYNGLRISGDLSLRSRAKESYF